MKKLKDYWAKYRSKHQRTYNYKGHSKFSAVTAFYIRQTIKSLALLYIAYIPLSMVRQMYLSVAALNTIDTKTAFIAQETSNMYGTLAAVLMGIAIYCVIFQINWHYSEYLEIKIRRKARMSELFKPEYKKSTKTAGEVFKETYEDNKYVEPLDKLNAKLEARRRKVRNEKRKALNNAKSKPNRTRKHK